MRHWSICRQLRRTTGRLGRMGATTCCASGGPSQHSWTYPWPSLPPGRATLRVNCGQNRSAGESIPPPQQPPGYATLLGHAAGQMELGADGPRSDPVSPGLLRDLRGAGRYSSPVLGTQSWRTISMHNIQICRICNICKTCEICTIIRKFAKLFIVYAQPHHLYRDTHPFPE